MRHTALKKLLTRLISDFENNPNAQFKFHKYAMYFWLLNALVSIILVIWFQRIWTEIGVYWIFLVSLYANWDTDYDAMSASGSWIEAKKIHDVVKDDK